MVEETEVLTCDDALEGVDPETAEYLRKVREMVNGFLPNVGKSDTHFQESNKAPLLPDK